MGYIDTIITGLAVFPFLAALFTMPYALFQYHSHGSVSKYRTLVIYSFILYLLIAYFLVTLPLPERDSTIGNRWQDHLSLVPFQDIAAYWEGKPFGVATIFGFFRSFALWQVLFNILLTVPFGVYLRYYFKQSLLRTTVLSFGLSLFFELTQLSALYGFYPGPYRLAAVEDLITNTLGGVVGWQIAYLFMMVLPDRDTIDERSRVKGRLVTGKRRFWATFFDYLVSDALLTFLAGGLAIVFPGSERIFDIGIGTCTVFCINGLIQALATRGTTLGHAICRMRLASEDGGAVTRGQIVKRYALLWLFVELPSMIVVWINNSQFLEYLNGYVFMGIIVASNAYMFYYFFNEVVRRGVHPMPHDTLSGTAYVAIEIPEKRA